MTWNPTNPEHRAVMRDLIGDGEGIDFTNVAKVLGCHPAHGPVIAALDLLDELEAMA